ncbi:MAG: DNA replication and repair protein RecF [Candidatus Marinimicrobia bacterium]|nr:DNA replication and repair protein RecF [Candidatus Neomarinimicrobiota bacterium]
MILRNLRLVNFRRYTDSVFEFHHKTNFINGENGSGKTSILEAIHYLSLTKSFRTNNDSEAVQYHRDYFNVFGKFTDTHDKDLLINVNYSKADGRSLLLNKARIKRYADIVGLAPVVILSPGLQKITEGGPAERRNFINRIISQTDRDYFLSLIEYKHRLTQRNTVLNRYRDRKHYHYDAYFEAQDEMLAKTGKKIDKGRQAFLIAFEPIFKAIFKRIKHIDSQVEICVKYNLKTTAKDYTDKFMNSLKERFERDVVSGRTSCGPHLDEIIILYNDREIRQIGSQGEHKLVLIALKLAEGAYLESFKNEGIIFLLDDLFAFLDSEHCRNIVLEIGEKNQSLITSTDIKELKKYGFIRKSDEFKTINITTGEA